MTKVIKKPDDDINILIVEDSLTQAEELQHILEKAGYNVLVANNGEEALEILNKTKPSLVVSDILMPKLNGFELCRKIKEDLKFLDIPVILLTSLSDPNDIIKGLDCGADNFVNKPYDENYLLFRIDYLLANQQSLRTEKSTMGIEIFFGDKKHYITSNRLQILNLLLSTYETAVKQNLTLIKTQKELKHLNEHLELKVEERTKSLQDEIVERKKVLDSLCVSEEHLRYEKKRIQTLFDISSGLYSVSSFKDIGRIISDILERYRLGESIGIKLAVYDSEEDIYQVVFFTGESIEEVKNTFHYVLKPCPLKDVMYYSKIAIQQKEAFLITDSHSEYSLSIDSNQNNLERSSMIFIPLFNRNELIGLFSFARSPENSLDKDFIDFLISIGELVGMVINQLLSEKRRKKIELEIIKSEKRYHSLFNNMLEGLAYCKMLFENEKPQDFIYLEVNESFEKITGLKNVMGKKVTEVIPGIKESNPELLEIYGRVSLSGLPEKFEIYIDTLKIWLSMSVYSPVKEYFVSIFDNITERKQAEEKNNKLNAELEQRVIERTAELESANKDLEAFSYSVSHDLRAPLRAINGFSQILVNRYLDKLDDDGHHYFENIIEASDRMSRLIDDILKYSRLGRKSLSFSSVSLKELFDRILMDYEEIISANKTEIIITQDLPEIESDYTLLNLILSNLINNAIKYHKKNVPNKIEIDFEENDARYFIRVKDNGIGIGSEYNKKIFDVFQRLHTEDEYPGTGIGLAIVKKCADLLGAEVYLESSVINEGSVFCIKLPKE